MRNKRRQTGQVAFLFAVSLVGLMVSVGLLNPVPLPPEPGGDRIIALFVYGSICTLGIMAVLVPTVCSGAFAIRRVFAENLVDLERRATRVLGVYLLHGHHPPEAIGHELLVRGKSFCANCFGLLTGASLALPAIAVFALSGWPSWIDVRLAYVLYSLGVVQVILGFVQYFARGVGAWARFVLSSIFVVGTSFMLIATDAIAANMTADLYVSLLAVFWLLSRISLSNRG